MIKKKKTIKTRKIIHLTAPLSRMEVLLLWEATTPMKMNTLTTVYMSLQITRNPTKNGSNILRIALEITIILNIIIRIRVQPTILENTTEKTTKNTITTLTTMPENTTQVK